MKARLLQGWNGHAAGEVIEHAQPGTGPGRIAYGAAEWFDDDDDVKAKSERAAAKLAAEKAEADGKKSARG